MKRFLMFLLVLILSAPVFASQNPVASGNFVFTVPLFEHGKGSGDLWDNTDTNNSFGVGSIGYSAGAMSAGDSFNTIGIQYFIFNGMAIGTDLGYNKFSIEGDKFTITTLAPQATYYINTDPILLYAGCGYSYKRIKQTEDDAVILTSAKVKGGLAIMISSNFALYGEAVYSWDQVKESGEKMKGNWLSFSTGLKAFF